MQSIAQHDYQYHDGRTKHASAPKRIRMAAGGTAGTDPDDPNNIDPSVLALQRSQGMNSGDLSNWNPVDPLAQNDPTNTYATGMTGGFSGLTPERMRQLMPAQQRAEQLATQDTGTKVNGQYVSTGTPDIAKQVNPSILRTLGAAGAQWFLGRHHPGAAAFLSNALTSTDPNVRAHQELLNQYQIAEQQAQQERQNLGTFGNLQLRDELLRSRMGNTADAATARKYNELGTLERLGAEPITSQPSGFQPPPSTLPQLVPLTTPSGPRKFEPPTPQSQLPPLQLLGATQTSPELGKVMMLGQPPVNNQVAGYQQVKNPLTGQPMQIPTQSDRAYERTKAIQEAQQIEKGEDYPDLIDAGLVSAGRTYTTNQISQKQRLLAAQNKSEKPLASKDTFAATMQKVAAAGLITPATLTNTSQQFAAIKQAAKSGAISPDEANAAIGYMTANPTPAQTTTAGILRLEGLAATRMVNVLDKETGEQTTLTVEEAKQNPGRYMNAGTGAQLMQRAGIFRDIGYNVRNARSAIGALAELDPETRAQITYALRDTDPKSSVSTFLTGAIGTHMTPQQKDAVIALRNLSENALLLRSMGMGQGSDMVRNAILATIPSGKSPDKQFALKQLDQFEGIVNRLASPIHMQLGPKLAGQMFEGGEGQGQSQPRGAVTVTDPNGGVHTFPDQASANKFKVAAGIH